MKTGKVQIIGKSIGWQDAPEGIESWGITQIILMRPVDLVIDMNIYDGRWGPQEQRDAVMAKEEAELRGVPFIGLQNYPLDDVVAYFGSDYFGSTVDYAIALAVFRGFTEIDIYGVNLIDDEYAYQKPSMEYWIGMARGRGVKVTVNGSYTKLLKTRDGKLYGYDTEQRFQ